jgi:hypothetical protein
MTSGLGTTELALANSNGLQPRFLQNFPKIRPAIDPDIQDILHQEYKSNRSGGSTLHRFVMWLESWMHHKVAGYVPPGPVLELGAGTLNHLQYEHEVRFYDVVEPYEHWYENSPHCGKVRTFFRDISQIVPVQPAYTRIISIAVLEHVTNLPECVARAALLLKKNGVFQAGIPSEGGMLWGLAWRMSTGLSFWLRTGKDYGQLNRHEHVNTAAEILEVVNYFFERIELTRFPLNHPHLSTYTYFIARQPKVDLCKEFLLSI